MDSFDFFCYMVLFTILGVIAIGAFSCLHTAIPEEGSHVGYITETGYRGLLWKTHYIKVVDQKLSFGEDAKSYWYYGVDEKDLSLFEQAKNETGLISMNYRCDFFVWSWERSESCIMTSFKRVN